MKMIDPTVIDVAFKQSKTPYVYSLSLVLCEILISKMFLYVMNDSLIYVIFVLCKMNIDRRNVSTILDDST